MIHELSTSAIDATNASWYNVIALYLYFFVVKLGHLYSTYMTGYRPFLLAAILFAEKRFGFIRKILLWIWILLIWTTHFLRLGGQVNRRNNARKRLSKTNPNYIYRK